MSVAEPYRQIVSGLPSKPGVYQFIDAAGNIIYVGKAKNLKKRVASYFTGRQSGKTSVMLKKAAKLHHIVVDNESDALLLENSLIKKHQPRYNILLKDDKTFPWICVKNERFPRVFSTRNVIRDGSDYFGPYTSVMMVKTLLSLVRQLYKLRTCNHNLSQQNISAGKFRVCLEYHLGNCRAPCVGMQDEEEYNGTISQIKTILKGHIGKVLEHLRKIMSEYSEALRFEEAQAVKEKIELLTRYRSKSLVVSSKIKDVDVFAFTSESDRGYVNYLRIIEGAIVQSFTLEMRLRMDEEKESLLGFAINEIRERYKSDAPEIIVPFKPDIMPEGIRLTIPVKGEKLKLLELAERNAIYYRLEQKRKIAETMTVSRSSRNLEQLKYDLHMNDVPVHIECFDNSNIMGKNPVSSCVVFRNAKPSKKEYRHFNIKSVKGPDDFASMEEVIFRRYRRSIEENQPLPQLVIIDGGKGQLSSAMKSIDRLGLRGKMTVIGIAKKLEEIYFPGDSVPIYLDKNSISLKLIQQIRNEAHRFGINFHRLKRSSGLTASRLDEIKGIGPVSKEILLKNFRSIDDLVKASEEDLAKYVGRKRASIIYRYFHSQEPFHVEHSF